MNTPDRIFERIAFVKTGWAELYQGDRVIGRHRYINQKFDAHEKYNFQRSPDGRFYGYLPPIGGSQSSPKPAARDDWLIVFTAAHEGTGPLVAVGWYEQASFHQDREARPEYAIGQAFPRDSEGNEYIFCLEAPRAFLIPADERIHRIPSDHFKTSPILYARGEKEPSLWREEYAKLAEQIVASAKSIIPD